VHLCRKSAASVSCVLAPPWLPVAHTHWMVRRSQFKYSFSAQGLMHFSSCIHARREYSTCVLCLDNTEVGLLCVCVYVCGLPSSVIPWSPITTSRLSSCHSHTQTRIQTIGIHTQLQSHTRTIRYTYNHTHKHTQSDTDTVTVANTVADTVTHR
jgi:hypothetical protein